MRIIEPEQDYLLSYIMTQKTMTYYNTSDEDDNDEELEKELDETLKDEDWEEDKEE